jgi:signal transduction histidine kinase/FixJ family two-component response regulator
MTETSVDPGSSAEPGGRHILLIDDDQDLADSLARLLTLEGYVVTVAYSLSEALASRTLERSHVALVDMRLGLDSGVDLVRALHERRPELVAVMMTAYGSQEATVEALRAGAYDYLSKPFHSTHLFATLDRCFEHSALLTFHRESRAALEVRNRALEDANARLTDVLASVRELSCAASVADVTERLLAAVMRVLKAAGGAIYWAEDKAFRRSAPVAGYPERIALASLPPFVIAAIEARQPVVMSSRKDIVDMLAMEDVESTLIAPLVENHEAMLALLVVHTGEGGRFDQRDLSVAHILATFGAEVIHAARMHESLARSEERLRKIVEHSPSAIALSDLQGVDLLVNDRFTEWFLEPGQSGGGAPAGKRWSGVALDPSAVETSGSVTREVQLTLPDGAQRHLLVTQFPVFDGKGEPSGVGTIGTDVTERYRAEDRLRQAQRMEAMGQLTGGIAHDFNNLLAVVLGNLRLIEGMGATTPDFGELVSDALDATRSGIDLVGRLLAFGRGQPLQPEPTDIGDLVHAVSRLLTRTLGEAIIINVDLAADLWSAQIDRGQLEASVLNLAINARDAMPNGGKLTITVRNAMIDADTSYAEAEMAPGPYVTLAVSDNGVGMSPEVRRAAVQPFFTTKPTGRGSGLGLSMVYGFARQSGGNLRIDSAPGEGTTVTLCFPALLAPLATPPSRRTQASPGASQGERVLLVEDQAPVRVLLTRILTRLGYAAVAAPDAAAALIHLAESSDFSVLLTDVVLPGKMNGVQLGEAALEKYPGLGVILTTGYAAAALSERTGPIAAAPVLVKPVEPEALALALRTVIGESTRRSRRD